MSVSFVSKLVGFSQAVLPKNAVFAREGSDEALGKDSRQLVIFFS